MTGERTSKACVLEIHRDEHQWTLSIVHDRDGTRFPVMHSANGFEVRTTHEPCERTPTNVSAGDIDQLASYYEHGADVDKEVAGELAQRDAYLIGEALRALQRERTAQPPFPNLGAVLDSQEFHERMMDYRGAEYEQAQIEFDSFKDYLRSTLTKGEAP